MHRPQRAMSFDRGPVPVWCRFSRGTEPRGRQVFIGVNNLPQGDALATVEARVDVAS